MEFFTFISFFFNWLILLIVMEKVLINNLDLVGASDTDGTFKTFFLFAFLTATLEVTGSPETSLALFIDCYWLIIPIFDALEELIETRRAMNFFAFPQIGFNRYF